MTDNEINVAICETTGKVYHRPTEEEKRSGSYCQYEPDFTKDLNAIHSAVNSLGHSERLVFLGCLSTVLERKDPDRRRWLPELIIESTPRDWCEGLLLAMGKCKESP